MSNIDDYKIFKALDADQKDLTIYKGPVFDTLDEVFKILIESVKIF